MRSEQDRSRDCLRAAGAIEDFGDGHVGRMRWMLLRRHVKECEECGAYFSRMGAVVDALAKLQAVQAPEDFAQLVMSRLLIGLADAAWERSEDSPSRRNLLWVAAAGFGVAMAVGLAIVRWALGRQTEDKLIVARPA